MILVCGEALYDVYPGAPGKDGLILQARAGGSPFNVAVGLARQQRPVAFFGGLSRGRLGQRLYELLTAEQVVTDTVRWRDAPTTLSLVDTDAQGQPVYRFLGDGAADRALGLEDLPPPARRWAAVHVGSLASVVPPVAQTLRALVHREYERGATITFDANVRLSAWPDVHEWRQQLRWMLKHAHLMKVSTEDVDALFPGQDPIALAREWHRGGVAVVIVTRGACGAWAVCADGELSCAAAPLRHLADTVGAGDCFMAACLALGAREGWLSATGLAGLTRGELLETLRFANHAASWTCGHIGARMPTLADLDDTYDWSQN